MLGLNILSRFFNKERPREDSSLNYYEDIFSKKAGLVVILIDMQPHYVKGLKEEDKERIVSNQILVIRWCVQKNITVIVLEYKWAGETISVLAEDLSRLKNLKTIRKPYKDGLGETELGFFLDRLSAKSLFLMGISTNSCVKQTAEGAIERSYRVITSDDVIAGKDGDKDISWYKKNGIVVSLKDFIQI